MTDILSTADRSRLMSRIKAVDTKPELIIRRGLHALGFRYKLHDGSLPGTPDLVFPKYGAIVDVRGCFWHVHDCPYFQWPKTRSEFWKVKLTRNLERDREVETQRRMTGWRTLVVWECSVKRVRDKEVANIIDQIASWLIQGTENEYIPGESK